MAKKETGSAALRSKETGKSAPDTVASKAAEKIAADVLKQNPDINEVHVTSDGTAFYTRNDAQNHANSLKNREVFSTKRGIYAVKAAATKSKGKSPEKNPETADNEPEVDELTGEPINNEPENAEA